MAVSSEVILGIILRFTDNDAVKWISFVDNILQPELSKAGLKKLIPREYTELIETVIAATKEQAIANNISVKSDTKPSINITEYQSTQIETEPTSKTISKRK